MTTYGFMYQMWTRGQYFLMSTFLSEYAGEAWRYSLPLLSEGEQISVEEALADELRSELYLRLVYMLEQYRRNVFGYEPPPEGVSEAYSLSSEWVVAREILHEVFGFPMVSIVRAPDDLAVSGADRYQIDDVLESHAHALSSLWMMQAVERFGLPNRITEELLNEVNEQAVGPYGAFLSYAPDLPVEPKLQLFMFCAFCDLALNPPGYHFTNPNPDAVQAIADRVWSPSERIWSYLERTISGNFPVPHPETGSYPEWEFSYLAQVKESLGIEGENILPFKVDISHQLNPIIEKAKGLLDAEDTHEALTTVWLDTIGTSKLANEIRQHVPLLLGGGVIEDLQLLISSIGGPNVFCKIEKTERIYHRVCAGLSQLGMVPKEELLRVSDLSTRMDISVVEAIRKLLLMNHSEAAAAADEKPFGKASLSLTKVLSMYSLTLDDFD
jgi:hypothetical protein